MNFKDHFSGQAAEYAKFRPVYPDALFEYLANVVTARNVAWDCATGSGQAALALAKHFQSVIASDASEKQIANAQPNERVQYRVSPAEQSGIESNSIDLVTVAQALHWFDLPKFYAEAKRVLKPAGFIAVWNYDFLQINPAIDAIVNRFYHEIVGPFWPPERRVIEEGYATLAFPFREIESPRFRIEVRWSLAQLIGYLETWSATQRFIETNDLNPLTLIANELEKKWNGRNSLKLVVWPLTVRIGRAKQMR
jgi:SAM-dependent methyltransferase